MPISIDYKNKYITVCTKDDTQLGNDNVFSFVVRKDKVVVLPYYENHLGDIYLILLKEPISIWGGEDGEIVALTGTIDNSDSNPLVSASRELFEETGIICSPKGEDEQKWNYIGSYCFDKGVRSNNHLFLVNVANCKLQERSTDGSWFEQNTKLAVSNIDDYQVKSSKDIYLHYMIGVLVNQKLITNIKNINGEENDQDSRTSITVSHVSG